MLEQPLTWEKSDLTASQIAELQPLAPLWDSSDVLLVPGNNDPRYLIGFANSDKAVERACRLRYEVFNLELGEGLNTSHASGLDRDHFDGQMTHLLLIDRSSGQVVGTYRLQTVGHGLANNGVYSAREYDLSPLEPWFDTSVECGRACISREHRGFRTLHLLWTGIGAFLNTYRHHLLFGCCSLSSTDPDDGWRALKTIRRKRYLHPEIKVATRAEFSCGDSSRLESVDGPIPLPKLFRAYMTLGARVVSEPALDREFQTVDFLVLLDGRQVQLSSLDILK